MFALRYLSENLGALQNAHGLPYETKHQMTLTHCHSEKIGECGGLVVEPRTPERGLIPTSAVL